MKDGLRKNMNGQRKFEINTITWGGKTAKGRSGEYQKYKTVDKKEEKGEN